MSHKASAGVDRVGRDVDLEELDDDEVRQLARSSIYTWEFTNLTAADVGIGDDPPLDALDTHRARATAGDDPPDPPE